MHVLVNKGRAKRLCFERIFSHRLLCIYKSAGNFTMMLLSFMKKNYDYQSVELLIKFVSISLDREKLNNPIFYLLSFFHNCLNK